ncbi:hypothetical protein [Streptacidiphilus fuscans]|uniref:Helix-turn-helix domain-containing protein n=1 Tax=Streptacidiphilus fuscans TaxID=2789292 RepID=A0A931BA41_9ACTN|nr:hypothetical protein [Streptacidiphilus fuscans]MBF9071821.1 hypothetical protein [Streptacidiphilus fuscans]
MRVHREEHVRSYLVLPNQIAQDRRLSYTARGLLADLLSRPDGWAEDGRQMADTSPQGRTAIRNALRELREFGYYLVETVRLDDGRFLSVTHVYDTPQKPGLEPSAVLPDSGYRAADHAGTNPVKDEGKVPTLPAPREGREAPEEDQASRAEGEAPAKTGEARPVEASDPQTKEAVAALHRVIRAEPRLRIGMVEALTLAPMVTTWLERSSEKHLAAALLPCLPSRIHHPLALLRDRLHRKMPPAAPTAPPRAAAPGWTECPTCFDPLRPGEVCRPCAGLGERRRTGIGSGEAATAHGAARARAALRGSNPLALALA